MAFVKKMNANQTIGSRYEVSWCGVALDDSDDAFRDFIAAFTAMLRFSNSIRIIEISQVHGLCPEWIQVSRLKDFINLRRLRVEFCAPADSADEDAQAELIQTHAEACLRQMRGQSSNRLGVQALDDLGLPQRDLDRMKARMTPKGRPAGERQAGFTD
ncbi:hypothetical protein CNMCM7691_008175 [Aspergillus felis]|uniref:Uncharacterized protein n=1 Tax=Aspergillus felis TaxID=1287682 RepID=A0A8H6QUC8_9EURO|nr:hypothetical protein CNMCM7691_008175 [Aspergillus felis]